MISKVLVTDSSERAALAVIRSLGAQGINVVAADSTSFNSGFLSKYCKRRILYPSPEKSKSKFVESMLRLLKREKFDLLIPITDFCAFPILESQDQFEKHVKVALPPYEVAIKAFDKIQTYNLAKQIGVPCPRTFLLSGINEVKEIAGLLKYPVVIKPKMKVVWVKDSAITLKVTEKNYAFNREDLIAKYSRIMSELSAYNFSDLFMAQEFAKGVGYGVEVLMHDRQPKAVFVHRRIREYPITGGASTLRTSAKNNDAKRLGVELLRAMSWDGVAMVEFRIDEESGEINLIEVNGRFWGSLQLAINSGVDYPSLLFTKIMSNKIDPCVSYKEGVIQRWLIPGDLLWLLDSIKSGTNKVGSLKEFFSLTNAQDDIISPGDLSPTAGVLIETFLRFLDVIKGKKTLHGENRLKSLNKMVPN